MFGPINAFRLTVLEKGIVSQFMQLDAKGDSIGPKVKKGLTSNCLPKQSRYHQRANAEFWGYKFWTCQRLHYEELCSRLLSNLSLMSCIERGKLVKPYVLKSFKG